MAARANLTIDKSATFSSDVFVTDTDGTAFDLTGYTAAAKMAKGYASTQTRVTLTTQINSDPTTGIITISLTADQTKNLDAPARYVYDVEITKTSDSTVTRVIEGLITVSPDVTTD
jgi:hypothetical protein